MTWWWIGNAIVYLVVLPLVVVLLHRLHRTVVEIRRYADDALEHGVGAIAHLDAVDELAETRDRVRLLRDQVTDYGGAVTRLLS